MRKPDFFNKHTTEKLGLDATLVKKVNSFFWRVGVKQNLSNASYASLFLKNLGTIVISKYKLYREIEDLISKLRGLEESTYYTEKRKGLIRENARTQLRQLLAKRNEIATELYKQHQDELAKRVPKTDS